LTFDASPASSDPVLIKALYATGRIWAKSSNKSLFDFKQRRITPRGPTPTQAVGSKTTATIQSRDSERQRSAPPPGSPPTCGPLAAAAAAAPVKTPPAACLFSCPHPHATPDKRAPTGGAAHITLPGPLDNRRVQSIFRRSTPPPTTRLSTSCQVLRHQLSFSFSILHSDSSPLLLSPLCLCLTFPPLRPLPPATAQRKGRRLSTQRSPSTPPPPDRDPCSAQSTHGGTCKALRCLCLAFLSFIFLFVIYIPPTPGDVSLWNRCSLSLVEVSSSCVESSVRLVSSGGDLFLLLVGIKAGWAGRVFFLLEDVGERMRSI
jgi:hypothetical protein